MPPNFPDGRYRRSRGRYGFGGCGGGGGGNNIGNINNLLSLLNNVIELINNAAGLGGLLNVLTFSLTWFKCYILCTLNIYSFSLLQNLLGNRAAAAQCVTGAQCVSGVCVNNACQ